MKPTSERWPLWDLDSSLPSNSSSAYEETYGFMPCTESAVGNLFLMVVYGYMLFVVAPLLSNGSELWLVVMGSGVIEGLFLPVLGAFPYALLTLGRIQYLKLHIFLSIQDENNCNHYRENVLGLQAFPLVNSSS